nr:GNAT family N-acetyltransferase [Plastoroseomonas arctica]
MRDARAEEAPSLALIHRAAREAALPGVREAYPVEAVARWLARRQTDGARLRVAASANALAGYCLHGTDGEFGAMVFHLYLHPAWWRRGIGTRLLADALAAHGRLSLACLARNAAARTFYERHGFRVVAEADGAGTEEGEPYLVYAGRAAPTQQRDIGEDA